MSAVGGEKKIGLFSLIMVCVGSLVGGGVFSLPTDMSSVASPGAIAIAWLITGGGVISLSFIFYEISIKKPEVKGGIYAYARDGFGDFTGYLIGLGYWLASILSVIAGYAIVFRAMAYFFPIFTETNRLAILIGSSVAVWLYFLLTLFGAKSVAVLGSVITVLKMIPVVVLIIALLFAFKMDNFIYDFWGKDRILKIGSVSNQINNLSFTCLWMFVGVEGVAILANRAKNMKDVGKASVIGILLVLFTTISVSIMSIGVMERNALINLKTPSGAYILEYIIGPAGASLVNLSIIACVMGCSLNWILFTIEAPFLMAKDGLFPDFFKKESKNGVPINSLIVTILIMQTALIGVYFFRSAYQVIYMIVVSAFLAPYIFSALYVLKLIDKNEAYLADKKGKEKALVAVAISFIYLVFLLFNAKLSHLLISAIMYMFGIVAYVYAKKSKKSKIFTPREKVAAITLFALGMAVVVLLCLGKISL
jgi:arginine:ornithine antiporter/lysine permease